jgi:chemotaxis protein MotA
MKMDFSTVAGLGGTVLVIAVAMVLGSNGAVFFDPASFLLVLGGTLTAILARRSADDFVDHLRALQVIVQRNAFTLPPLAARLESWARTTRREGALALEPALDKENNPFLRHALMLLIDGANEDSLHAALRTRVANIQAHQDRVAATWEDWLIVAPAMGMIGTLIGLVQMLNTVQNTALLGQGMALALLTTLYGAFLANVIAGPVASKLRLKYEAEREWCEAVITGFCGMARGESPRRIANAVVTLFPADRAQKPGEAA